MIKTILKALGLGQKTDYAGLIREGAVIVDVRSRGEFQGGHIKGSLNIPVDSLASSLGKLKKEKTIITCCASGMRSAAAKNILKANGFSQVHNGGGWMSLQNKIR